MTRHVVLVLACMSMAQTPAEPVPAAVDAIVSGQVAAGRAQAAAVVVVSGDRITFSRGYGELDRGITIDPSTSVFRIASISKLFVATAAAELADEGRLDLQADIRRYLPDIAVRNPFPVPITTAQLLTHTSGIGDSFLHALASDPKDLLPLREFFRRYPPEVVERPGTGIAYSNLGMALAGAVVESVSGQTFDDFAEARLFGPLGMTRSSFRQPPPASFAPALVGGRSPRQPPLIRPFPAGALVATVTDMGRFLIAQLNEGRIEGRQALRAGAVALTHTRQFGDPRTPGAGYGFFDSALEGEHALFHTGDSGHHGLLWMLPSRRLGLYVVYATRDEGALEMREAVVRAALSALGAHAAPPASAPSADASDLAAYAGWYAMNGKPRRTFEHVMGLLGQVHVTAVDRTTLRIRPPGGGGVITATRLGADLFSTSEGGTLSFQRDAQQRPAGFTMTGSIWDPQGFHRVGWAETQPATLIVLAAAALCLVIRGFLSVSRLWRRTPAPIPTAGALARVGWRVSGILPFLLLAVPATAVAGIILSPPPYTDIPRGITLAFSLLTLASVMGALLPIAAAAALRERAWPGARRGFFAVYASAAFGLAWALFHWSLVPGLW